MNSTDNVQHVEQCACPLLRLLLLQAWVKESEIKLEKLSDNL